MLFVQPTVKSPDVLTKVAPALMITPAALFPAEFTVTVCATVTTSEQEGTPFGLQVAASFQSPEATEVLVELPCAEAALNPT